MIIALAALTAGLLLRRPKVDVFYSPAEACRSCATFYPKKTPNWHEDDMAWARECRVGKCSFEPPWAGGPQDEACENWNLLCDLWKDEGRCESSDKEYMRHACKKSCNLCDPLKQTKYCLSFDPVAWYDDCQKMLLNTANTAELASKACEYEEQITLWDRPQPFVALNEKGDDDCQATIAKGALYYSKDSMADSIGLPLESCCARVHSFFSCLGQLEPQLVADVVGLGKLDTQSRTTVENFKKYCVPLFQYPTRAEFCAAFPTSDPCSSYAECTACIEHKGKWCRTSKTCEVDILIVFSIIVREALEIEA
eukprot:GEMP01007000.1.p1 GENE.GEMP01007000.1~~GEMP01007000.1.p1  ORF type:complete len:310 (+),score=68.56 GEMP01007000.1:30-959(+)